MANRPRLSNSSFLSFIFHPKKALKPTGLRKTTLTGTKGRNKRRLAAYNRMPAANQEILKRAGQRDAYLRGDTTLAKAKAFLRETAVQLGVAKPVRQRHRPLPGLPAGFAATPLDRMIQQHLERTVRAEGRMFNRHTSDEEIRFLDPETGMLQWSYGQIKHAGRKDSEYEVVTPDGVTHNPMWYH